MSEWIPLPTPPDVREVATGFYTVTGVSTAEAYSARLVHSGMVFAQHVTNVPGVQHVQAVVSDDAFPRGGWSTEEWRTPFVVHQHDPRNARNSMWDTDWQMDWEANNPESPWYYPPGGEWEE